MNKEFEIPIAEDSLGNLIRPEDGIRGDSYTCPSCKESVILRKGEVKRPHFAHRSNANCSPETVLHKAAKRILVKTISRWKNGYILAPTIGLTCEVCRSSKQLPLDPGITHAEEEVLLMSDHRADIVLFRDSHQALAIEVYVTHRVDENKRNSISIPYIEVDARKVIEDVTVWQPLSSRYAKSFLCGNCRRSAHLRQMQEEIEKERTLNTCLRVAQEQKIPLQHEELEFRLAKCFNCKEATIIFRRRTSNLSRHLSTLALPRTITRVPWRTLDPDNLVNTCTHCSTILDGLSADGTTTTWFNF